MTGLDTQKLISVIIPTFERFSGLDRALSGVGLQTYKNLEVIVVDDNSRFESNDRVRKICARRKATYIMNQRNKGGNGARNTGVMAARGKYIAFLDDDDYWLEEKLSAQVAFMERDKLACSFVGHYSLHQRLGVFTKPLDSGRCIITREDLLSGVCPKSLSLAMIKADTFDSAGLFDESLPSLQDFELLLRVAQREPMYFLNESLVIITEHTAPRVSIDLTVRLRGLELLKGKLAPKIDANLLNKLMKDLKIDAYEANARRIQHDKYFAALRFRMLALKERPTRFRHWILFLMGVGGAWFFDLVCWLRREKSARLKKIYAQEFMGESNPL